MATLMKCGHVAQAKDGKGNPCCAICAGINPDGMIVDRECSGTDGLEGRTARCGYGAHADVPSKWELPFFEYRPDKPFDSYYCGCKGWD